MNTPELEVSFGAKPSKKDRRDIPARKVLVKSSGFRPAKYKIDYSSHIHLYQKKLGVCTAAALVQLIEKKRGDGVKLSVRFLYNVGKHFIDMNLDEGSSLRTMLKAAYKYGVATEASVPSDFSLSHAEFVSKIDFPASIWEEALQYRIPGYARVNLELDNLQDVILSENAGIYSRVEVGKEWYTDKNGIPTWSSVALLPLRTPKRVESGHAIGVVGFDSSVVGKDLIEFRNTWSDRWADNGDGRFYYKEYHPKYFTECWVITDSPQEAPSLLQIAVWRMEDLILLIKKYVIKSFSL